MTAEEIAIRREVRQMLNEAGFGQEELKKIISEEIRKLVDKRMSPILESIYSDSVLNEVRQLIENKFESEIRNQVMSLVCGKRVQISIQ